MVHVIAFTVLLIAAGVGFPLHADFLRELRSRHPAVWESLGRPTLFMNNSIANGLAVMRFLWRKEYEALNDRDFAQKARVLRTLSIAYLFLFAVIVVIQFYVSGGEAI
jgi:Trk-type K+ transport system membrane component